MKKAFVCAVLTITAPLGAGEQASSFQVSIRNNSASFTNTSVSSAFCTPLHDTSHGGMCYDDSDDLDAYITRITQGLWLREKDAHKATLSNGCVSKQQDPSTTYGVEFQPIRIDSTGLVHDRPVFTDPVEVSKAIFTLTRMSNDPSSKYEVLWCGDAPDDERHTVFGMERYGHMFSLQVLQVLCGVERELATRQFFGESPEQALQEMLKALNNEGASPLFVGGYFYIKGEKGKPTYIARISSESEDELPTRIEQIPVTSRETVIKMPRGNRILLTVSDEFEQGLLSPKICPIQDESLDAYTTRMCAMIEQDKTFEPYQVPSAVLANEPMSWEIERYLLAMDIESGLYNPEDKHALCSSAMENNDLEMLLFAAQHDITCDTQSGIYDPFIAFLMQSNDTRSVELLKLYLPETGVIQVLDTVPLVADTKDLGAWAKELSPELVVAKAEIAYPAPRDFSRCLSEYVKGDSEGELALKEYILTRERPGFIPGVHLNPLSKKKPIGCAIL